MGTVAYMSPEQTRGEEVDHRTDIWSLGVVLYEMIARELPFKGEYKVAIVYSIINSTPEPLDRYNADVSAGLQKIIDKALAKNIDTRYQNAIDLLNDLKTGERTLSKTIRPALLKAKLKSSVVKFALLSIFAVLIIISAFYLYYRSQSPQISPSHKQVTFTGKASSPAISPDGKYFAYLSDQGQDINKVVIQEITGGQPVDVFTGQLFGLRWSPDGSELLGSYEKVPPGNRLVVFGYLIPRFGGDPRKLSGINWGFCSWAPNGIEIVKSLGYLKKIWITNKLTGETKIFTPKGFPPYLRYVDWSPVSDLFVLLTVDKNLNCALWIVQTDFSDKNKIFEDSAELFSACWSPRGDAIYFLREQNHTKSIMKIMVDPASGKPKGQPKTLIRNLQMGKNFTVSKDGKRLLYTRELSYSNLYLYTVEGEGKDRQVSIKKLTKGTSKYTGVSVSPNGKMIAFSKGHPPIAEIFTMPIDGGTEKQLTFMNAYNAGTAWSPDGNTIAYGSRQGDSTTVWTMNVNGGNPRQFRKTEFSKDLHLLSWSPGSEILYPRPGNRNFHFLDPETGEERPFVQEESAGVMISPPLLSRL